MWSALRTRQRGAKRGRTSHRIGRRPQSRGRVGRSLSSLGARTGWQAGPDLGGRARRHEHANKHILRQRPRHAAGGAARVRAVGIGRHWRVRAESRPGTNRAHRGAKPGRGGKGPGPRVENSRLYDEGHRSRGHRSRNRAGDRHWPDATPPASTSRSISTSAIPPSRPASGRLLRAVSTTARDTW